MRGYLVVANQTLDDEHLLARVGRYAARDTCTFHLVVPATPSSEHLTWTLGEARAEAQRRLDTALATLRGRGVDATGEVGDSSPMLAVRDSLRHRRFDGIIVATLAPGVSRWLRQDLPNRMRRAFHLPVDHVKTGAVLVA